MREITGNLWDYYGKPDFIVCITTNGTVKRNGEAVMGRGCAREAARRFPALPHILGGHLRHMGNTSMLLTPDGSLTYDKDEGALYTFPVKDNWWEPAKLSIIEESAGWLEELAFDGSRTFVLPRPGCGNGHLAWPDVRAVLLEVGLPDNVWVISRSAAH